MERLGEITGWPHITFGRKRKIHSDALFIERESNKIITVLLYCPIGKCSAIIYILKLLYARKTPDDSNGRHVWINVTWHFIERSFISGIRGPVGERIIAVCDLVCDNPRLLFFFRCSPAVAMGYLIFWAFELSYSCSPGPKVMEKVVKRKGVDHRLWKGEEPGVGVAGKRGDRAFSSLKELRYPENVNIWLSVALEMFFKK